MGAEATCSVARVKRIDIMDNRVPELAQHWSANAAAAAADKSKHDDDVQAQEAELEQLAERVTAARSVY